MTTPNRQRSQRLLTALDHIKRIGDQAQDQAMKAEDVLTSLEDREARRSSHVAADDPRQRITGY